MTKEELETVRASVKEDLHAAIKEFSDQHKSKVVAGSKEEKDARREVIGSFFKALAEQDDVVLKDLSEGSDADGGYIVPVEFRQELIEKLYKGAYIRRYATVIPMSSDKMDMPVEANTVTTNWTPELTAMTQSDPTFDSVQLIASMLAGISRQSRQLLADAAVNQAVQDYLVRIFARALGLAEDTAFMVGSGADQPKGIRAYKASFATIGQAGASLVDSDLDALMYKLPRQYRRNACWIMRDDRVKLISSLRATTGVKLHPEIDSIDNPMLKGRPVIVQDDIPGNLGGGTESEIYFGDLSFYYIGDREQVFAETSIHEGTSWAQHRAAVKVGQRLDGRLTVTDAFAYLTAVK